MMRLAFLLLLLCSVSLLNAQEIAITFDDAPMEDGVFFSGNERTGKLITELKANNVDQAAFFVITRNIEQNAGLPRLNKYVSAGHVLANHTHRHLWMHQIGTRQYIKDIERAHAILNKINGYSPWFRYPFLNEGHNTGARDSVRAGLKKLGLSNGYVTIDNYDWYINGQVRKAVLAGKKVNEEKLRELYLEHIWNSIQFYNNISEKHLGRSVKHVLLLHENDLAAKFIGDLVKLLRSKGWKIISPTEAYTDPIASEVPDVLFNGQGRVAAIARAKGVPAKELVQESEDEAYLDRLLEDRKVFE